MKLTFLLLTVCLLLSCASPPKEKDLPKDQEPTKVYKPKLPPIFGLSLDENPQKLLKRLSEIGYQRENWELEAPYSKITLSLEDPKAVFRKVYVTICNNPYKTASLHILGADPEKFYPLVKQRFNLGIEELEVNDQAKPHFGTYNFEFADSKTINLKSHAHEAELTINAQDVIKQCQKNLTLDVLDLKQAEEKDLETIRQKQMNSF